MTRRLGTLFVVVLTYLQASPPKNAAGSAFQQIQAIVQSLSEISGLSELHPVAYGRMNKRQLRHFLAKRIRRTLRPDEIKADELALKMFGLVPQSFDLKSSTIDLLTEQAAAFYDYDEKKLFLLDDPSLSSEVTTLAHELSHALADQHFDLRKYMDEDTRQDDENLARSAVVEGEASWLMIAYDLKQAGQSPVPTHEALDAVMNSGEGSLGDYPVLKASPLYIQQSLLFPYTDGTMFFDAVFRKMGKAAFGAVFTDPPHDAAQIMHPERYFEHLQESDPALPQIRELADAPDISDGTVGEFDHLILLWQDLGEADGKALAKHLAGGQFRIVGYGKQKHPVLLYSSQWDSTEHAREFFNDYETALKKKWRVFDVSVRQDDLIAGQGDNGYFVCRRDGAGVTSVEGIPSREMMHSVQRQLDAVPPVPASDGLKAQIH